MGNGQAGGQVVTLRPCEKSALRSLPSLFCPVAAGVERSLPGGRCRAQRFSTAFTDRRPNISTGPVLPEDEATFTAQIYEPPLQYHHYLKRPTNWFRPPSMRCRCRYFDPAGRELPHDAPIEQIAEASMN